MPHPDAPLAAALATRDPEAVRQALAAIAPAALEGAFAQVVAHDDPALLPLVWERLAQAAAPDLKAATQWLRPALAHCARHHQVALRDALLLGPLATPASRDDALSYALAEADAPTVVHLFRTAPAGWSPHEPVRLWAGAIMSDNLPLADTLDAHVPLLSLPALGQATLTEHACRMGGLPIVGWVLAHVDRAAVEEYWERPRDGVPMEQQRRAWQARTFPQAEQAYQACRREQALVKVPGATTTTRRHRT